MPAQAIIAVWMNPARQHEREFNDWYEQEHTAEVVAIDGVVSGRRYFNAQGELRYLVLYEAIDASVESGPGFAAMLTRPTPWTLRIRTLCDIPSRRFNFRLMHDSGEVPHRGALLAVHSSTPAADPPSDLGCLRHRTLQDTARANAFLHLYDFEDSAHATAARAVLARSADARAEIYQAIGAPHVHADKRPVNHPDKRAM